MRSSAPIQRLKAAKLRRLARTMQLSPERTIKLERAVALELQAKAQDSDPSLRPIEAGRQKVLTDKFAMQELSERLRPRSSWLWNMSSPLGVGTSAAKHRISTPFSV